MFFHRRNRVFNAGCHLGGGALYSHLNDASQSETTLSQQFSQPDEKAAHDAAILAGEGLGLDPENDPVIARTDYGLGIKFHNDFTKWGTVSSQLSGYAYFTMGSYNGTPVNWVIIGKNSSLTNPSSQRHIQQLTYWSTWGYNKSNGAPDSTPAGLAIKTDSATKGLVNDFLNTSLFKNVVSSTEIPSNCVLCISERYICKTYFNQSSVANTTKARYEGSNLQSVINNLFGGASKNGLNFPAAFYNKIKPQTIRSYYYYKNSDEYTPPSTYCTSSNQYLFPLASNSYWSSSSYPQAFCVETYFGCSTSTETPKAVVYGLTENTTFAMPWYLRSGCLGHEYSSGYSLSVANVLQSGKVYNALAYSYNNGGTSGGSSIIWGDYFTARPAFVLQL